ncbi:hypothetical protein [Deinococcus sp. PEB2-63]
MPVKEAFHTADDRVSVRASWEARGGFGMPDVLALKECEHHEGKQLDLVFAELRDVRGKAAGQLGQDIGRRVLFSRVSRTFSSPTGKCRVLSGSTQLSYELNVTSTLLPHRTSTPDQVYLKTG